MHKGVYLNTAKTPKLRKDRQRHTKKAKRCLKLTKTRKDKDTQRRQKDI